MTNEKCQIMSNDKWKIMPLLLPPVVCSCLLYLATIKPQTKLIIEGVGLGALSREDARFAQ